MKRVALTLAAFGLASAPCFAQNGDVKGEEQPPLDAAWKLPPPKPLSPEEELATFHVDDGLRVELVACEPLVRDPVCATFDERGRLWVCEMSGFMPDFDGHGEDEPSGSVVVLSDEDGDGRMDKRTVFLDGLVLPRGVAPTRGGALVIAPPRLLFARDTDGDGRADDVRCVDDGLQGIVSPEHAINGLMYGLDNWFWCADAPVRYRWNGDRLERGRTAGSGQWGITEDAWGRIYTNDNSNPLRCDLYPSNYAVRNPNLGVAPGMNVNIAAGARPHPSHMTPGVNRGYRKGLLGDDGRLQEFTGACAPWIYEGDALPERYRGSAIVCEPCGNLLHRFEITNDEHGYPKATTAPPDGAMLTSTDERFRPVFLNEGPDGALYVVDMYRGVLQHKLFVTSWLRKQMEERELAQPLHQGRIWRITSGERKKLALDLTQCSWTELASCLASPNRWLRITAQRLIVEQGSDSRDAVAAVIEQQSLSLNGLNRRGARALPNASSAREALEPSRAAKGTRIGVSTGSNLDHLLSFMRSAESSPPANLMLIASELEPSEVTRGAIVAAVYGHELESIRALIGLPSDDGSSQLLELLARCVVNGARGDAIEGLVELVAKPWSDPWICNALVKGALSARSKNAEGKLQPIRLARQPKELAELRADASRPCVADLLDALIWPSKPGTEGMWPRDLTEKERARFERGQVIFEQTCASCHQLGGRGDAGIAPPLRDSPWVLGDATRVTKVVLRGLRGPIKFGDLTWDGEMPGFTASDDDVASILTYLRREWNHAADPIEADFVRDVRKATADRKGPWSVSELSK